jgi:hypothetical protein
MSRTAPPAMRRSVLAQAHHRCSVPGCRARVFLDVHHVEPWQFGGPTVPDNLLPVCPVHHTLVHSGRLSVERKADGRAVWRRPDGSVLGDEADRPDVAPAGGGGPDGATHVGVSLPPRAARRLAEDAGERAMFERLGRGPACQGELIAELHLDPSDVAAALTRLELDDLIVRLRNGSFVRVDHPERAWSLARGWVAARARAG